MTKNKDNTTQITVRDLSDAKIAEAILVRAGNMLYESALKQYPLRDVNRRMFKTAQELDHPGITDVEISALLDSMSQEEVIAQIERANKQHYNYIQIVEIPGADDKPIMAAVLSKQDGVTTDPVKHLVARVTEVMEGELPDGRYVADLPVIVLVEQEGSDKLKVRNFRVDLEQFAKDLA